MLLMNRPMVSGRGKCFSRVRVTTGASLSVLVFLGQNGGIPSFSYRTSRIEKTVGVVCRFAFRDQGRALQDHDTLCFSLDREYVHSDSRRTKLATSPSESLNSNFKKTDLI